MKDILTADQKLKALLWLKQHRKHVYEMVFHTKNKYPPTEIEDKNNPRLWKPEYWKWFLEEE